jgi:hypothetical protein
MKGKEPSSFWIGIRIVRGCSFSNILTDRYACPSTEFKGTYTVEAVRLMLVVETHGCSATFNCWVVERVNTKKHLSRMEVEWKSNGMRDQVTASGRLE